MENKFHLNKHLKRAIRKSLFSPVPSLFQLKQAFTFYSNYKQSEKRRQLNQIKFNSVIPPVCIFSVTWDCNLKCKGCYALNYEKQNVLTTDEIISAIKHVLDCGTYMFIIAGGEPLTIKELIPELGKISKGIFMLFTNGLLLDAEKIVLLRNFPNILPVISLEGEDSTTDQRRGINVSAKLKEAFSMLNKLRIPFGISSMATHKNLSQIVSKNYFEAVKKSGAVFLYIIDYIPFEFSLNESFVLTREDHDFKKDEIAKRMKDSGLTVYNFPADEYSDGYCESAGKGFLHINANGYVEPCPFSHYATDNIRDKNYIQIINSPFFKEIREKFSCIKSNSCDCLLHEHDLTMQEIAKMHQAFSTEKIKSS